MIGKVCQENDKALMSNPNRDLGKWILRTVPGIPMGWQSESAHVLGVV